jgi:hypothetical protein
MPRPVNSTSCRSSAAEHEFEDDRPQTRIRAMSMIKTAVVESPHPELRSSLPDASWSEQSDALRRGSGSPFEQLEPAVSRAGDARMLNEPTHSHLQCAVCLPYMMMFSNTVLDVGVAGSGSLRMPSS